MENKTFGQRWKTEFEFRTISNAVFAFVITSIFAIYNGVLGVKYNIVWNECIGLYYLLLAILRGMISFGALRYKESEVAHRERIHIISSVVLILLNIALVIPAWLMLQNKKDVNMSLVPTIAMVAYIVAKVSLASVNLVIARNTNDILVREIRNINFIDAVVSILTLQNTILVVLATTGIHAPMIIATAGTGIGLCVIIFLTLKNLVNGRKLKVM